MKKKICIFETHLNTIKKLNSNNNYENSIQMDKGFSTSKSFKQKINYTLNSFDEINKSSEYTISPKKKEQSQKKNKKTKSEFSYGDQINIIFSKYNKKENTLIEETAKNEQLNNNKCKQNLIYKINKAIEKGINVFTKVNLFEEVEFEEYENSKYREYMEDRILCEFIDKEKSNHKELGEEFLLTNSYIKSNTTVSLNSSLSTNNINLSSEKRELFIKEDNKKLSKIILFGIFDGHGGFQISSKLVEILPKEIHLRINNSTNENNIKLLLIEAFEKADKELMTKISECDDMGSTGSIAFLLKFKSNRILYTANIGDSHIYIVSNKKAQRLTAEHKCTNEEEVKRIKEKNALIFENRMFGQLALTRAFCDRKLKPYGLSAIPFVNSYVIKEKSISNKDKIINQDHEFDMFVVLASDGIWDIVNEEVLVQLLITDGREKSTKELCKILIDHSIKNGSKDNISIIIIKL